MSFATNLQGTIYGTTRYGQGYYGRPVIPGNQPFPTFSALPLTADAINYTEVSLTWAFPTVGNLLRLVRNSFNVSADETDGLILLEQPLSAVPAFIDRALSTDLGGTLVYYTLWNQDVGGTWWRGGDVQCVLPLDYGYADRLWGWTSQWYRYLDSQQQQGVLQP